MRRVARGASAVRGFTLVELLIVLVLLGVVAAMIVPAIGTDERRLLEREAARLAGALEQASATAQWRGETLGVSADRSAYRFWRRDGDGQWSVIAQDEVLGPRVLPTPVQIVADRFAGAPVAGNAILPLRPSGRNDPLRLLLYTSQWTVPVEADPLNRVTYRVLARAPTG